VALDYLGLGVNELSVGAFAILGFLRVLKLVVREVFELIILVLRQVRRVRSQ
jgi:hypothetical protein